MSGHLVHPLSSQGGDLSSVNTGHSHQGDQRSPWESLGHFPWLRSPWFYLAIQFVLVIPLTRGLAHLYHFKHPLGLLFKLQPAGWVCKGYTAVISEDGPAYFLSQYWSQLRSFDKDKKAASTSYKLFSKHFSVVFSMNFIGSLFEKLVKKTFFFDTGDCLWRGTCQQHWPLVRSILHQLDQGAGFLEPQTPGQCVNILNQQDVRKQIPSMNRGCRWPPCLIIAKSLDCLEELCFAHSPGIRGAMSPGSSFIYTKSIIHPTNIY